MEAYFNICLNALFVIMFTGLLKSIFSEIQQKISNKAAKILQVNSSSSFDNSILLLSLVQILIVCILITVIKLGTLRDPFFILYSTGDYVILTQVILVVKIGYFTRETIAKDVLTSGCCVCLLLVLININKESHQSLLELLNAVIIKLILLGPPIMCLLVSSFLLAACQSLSAMMPVILISVSLTLASMMKISNKLIYSSILLLQLIAFYSDRNDYNFIRENNHNLLSSDNFPSHQQNFTFENYSSFEDFVPKVCYEAEKENVPTKAIIKEELLKCDHHENTSFIAIQRHFLVIFAKNDTKSCLVEAVDVTDKNIFIKSFIKVSSMISDFIGVRIKMFNSVSLQGHSSFCKKLIGTEVMSTSQVFSNNQTLDDYYDWKLINIAIAHKTNFYVNNLFSIFSHARSALVEMIY